MSHDSHPRAPRPQEARVDFCSHATFWRPRHLEPSPWLVYVPLIFWLVEQIRPRTLVELGLTTGTAYFAAVQAAEKLDLGTRCLGVRLARANRDTGLPEALAEHNAAIYPDISRLLETDDLETAAREVASGEVEMLVLDLDLPSRTTKQLLRHWPARLADRAVVLVRGRGRWAGDDGDPGISAFLAALPASQRRTVLEAGGESLLLVLVGEGHPPSLMRLCEIGANGAGVPLPEEFARLGQGLRYEGIARLESAAWLGAEAEPRTLRADLIAARAALQACETTLAELDRALDLRGKQAAEAQAELHDMAGHVRTLRAEMDRRDAEQEERLRIRFEEIAWLTSLLERREVDVARIPRAGPPDGQDKAVQRLPLPDAEAPLIGPEAALLDYGRSLERRHKAVLDSRSWRLMEGPRRIARRLKGTGAAPPFRPRLDRPIPPAQLVPYLRDLEQRHMALLHSRSWRAGAPLRRVVELLKGRKPASPFVPRLDLPAGDRPGNEPRKG